MSHQRSNRSGPPSDAKRIRQLEREIEKMQLRFTPLNTHLNASWSGVMPAAVGVDGAVWRVPYSDGESITWTIVRATLRLETAGSTATTVQVQRSPGGVVFAATTVATVTAAASAFEGDTTGGTFTITSGELLRVNFTAIGTGAADYTVQIEGIAV